MATAMYVVFTDRGITPDLRNAVPRVGWRLWLAPGRDCVLLCVESAAHHFFAFVLVPFGGGGRHALSWQTFQRLWAQRSFPACLGNLLGNSRGGSLSSCSLARLESRELNNGKTGLGGKRAECGHVLASGGWPCEIANPKHHDALRFRGPLGAA